MGGCAHAVPGGRQLPPPAQSDVRSSHGFAALMLAPTFFLDPQVPAAFLALALAMGWALGGISPRPCWACPADAMLALALTLALSSTLFYGGPPAQLLFVLGPLRVYAEGLAFGLSIGLRMLCVVAYAALYVHH